MSIANTNPSPLSDAAPRANDLPAQRRIRRLRLIAHARRRYGPLVLGLPLLAILAMDVAVRGDRLAALRGKYMASYGAAMLESAVLWGLLLFAASLRRGLFRWVAALLFVTLGALSIGVQIYFHRQYATYLNLDATLFGTSLSSSVLGQLRADLQNLVSSLAPPLLLAVLLVWMGRAVLRPRARASALRWAALPALVAAFLLPCSYRTVQASTPDVIYFNAIGGLLRELAGDHATVQVRPGVRTPPALPAVSPRPSATAHPPPLRRNVLFVLTESVRADVACSAPGAGCEATPAMNAAVPSRLPLTQMRSSSSTTAIELAVLWSGLPPTSTREALHTAPLLFDYAHAAGYDTAYWTSHHMMFANSRLYVQDLPTSHRCGATDLDPYADIDLGADDGLLAQRAEAELSELHEPFFAVAHFGNTHVPYWIDPEDAPFQPALESKAPDDNEAYRNYYKNAVHRQDARIGALLGYVRASAFGPRTIIVFTSDHGEAFREHGQLCHTGAILDEEVHVPAWIDAPAGLLSDAEESALVASRDRLVSHTDVAPTILDLLGLLDETALAPYRTKMIGSSLLRPAPPPEAHALTNCSGIWGCAFKNWGMMRGSRKLEAREWDSAWHCYDVLDDPAEQHDLGAAACGDLQDLAAATYGGLPSAP